MGQLVVTNYWLTTGLVYVQLLYGLITYSYGPKYQLQLSVCPHIYGIV